MSLKDRADELDKRNDFYARANDYIELKASCEISAIEHLIKNGLYDTVNGKKRISSSMWTDFTYYTNRKPPYNIKNSPQTGKKDGFFICTVNDEKELKYILNGIIKRLEDEGCVCTTKYSSYKHPNGLSSLETLVKGHYVEHIYSIEYIFEW